MAGTIVANTINTDTGLFSTQNAYQGIAKAWAQFSAPSGTVSIASSFNVSSITVTNTGCYTVNFSTAMPNANYSVVGAASNGGNNTVAGVLSVFVNSVVIGDVAPTASNFLLQYRNFSGTAYHADYACFAVFSA